MGINYSYLAIDVSCVILVSIVLRKTNTRLSSFSGKRFFVLSMIFSLFLFLSDIAFASFKVAPINVAIPGIYTTNELYILFNCLLGYTWLLFILERLGYCPKAKFKKHLLFSSLTIPDLVLLYFAFSASLNHLLFYVDENGSYQRGSLSYLLIIIDGLYLFASAIISLYAFFKTKNGYKKKEYFTYAFFIVLPALGMGLQTFAPDVPFSSLGVALSYLILYFSLEDNRFSHGTMTGLYNKVQIERFMGDYLHKSDAQKKKASLYFIMMDLDEFKSINDTFGHIVGDEAIVEAANCIKNNPVIGHFYAPGRFGGDEFVILCSADESSIRHISNTIDKRINDSNESRGKKSYVLSFSKGFTKLRENDLTVQEIIDRADDNLYKAKEKRGTSR